MPEWTTIQVVHSDGTFHYVDVWGRIHVREVVVGWEDIDIVLQQIDVIPGDTIQIGILDSGPEESP